MACRTSRVLLVTALIASAQVAGAAPAAAAVPNTTIVTGPGAVSVATSATFTFEALPGGTPLQCSRDGGAWAACSSPQTLTGLANGSHNFRVRAVNADGPDPTPARWEWTVDTTVVPEAVITSGASQPATTRVATFIWRSVPDGATFECSRDGAAWVGCRSPRRETGFGDGQHTFRVRARGPAGVDPTPTTYTWTVDRTPVPTPPANVNVVVINADDMRSAGTLQAMPRTTRWFVDGGTRIPNGYVTTPDCCPSRSTLFSGRYTHNHGNLNNQTTKELDHAGGMAAYLQNAGYQTGMAGRFLQQWPTSTPPPFYDRWAVTSSGYADSVFNTDAGQLTAPYGTTEIGRQGVRMLDAFEQDDARPFFLYLAPFAPHTPFTAEAKYAGADVGPCTVTPSMSETDRTDKPAWVASEGVGAQAGCTRRQAQLRTLLSMDDMVDTVMTRLEQLGEASNTVAVFTSDNGYHWAEHGLSEKFSPYTESLQVPLLVRWPGRVPAGATDARLASANLDLLPSVLAATRVAPALRHPLDGRAFLTATGLGGTRRTESFAEQFTEAYKPQFPPWASVRTSAWQYVEWYAPSGAVQFREYYDLVRDPYQLTNLLADGNSANDPPTADIQTRLRAYRTCRGTGAVTNPCP